jgi:hypothetical protein
MSTPSQPRVEIPADYPRIKVVGSFEELVSTPFENGVNAMCWARQLSGDFREVVEALVETKGIASLDEALLRSLNLSAAGREAVEVLVEDLRLLEEHGLDPIVDCIESYPREDVPGVVRIDVYDFHVDSANAEADTYLCTYSGPTSEVLRNEDAIRCVDVPETRAALLAEFGGEDGEAFREFLNERCYDLHYTPIAGAKPVVFGIGNLWRIATEYPGSPVPPCVHRAPDNIPGELPRLLLIS